MTGLWRSVLIGAVLGVLVVGGLAAAAALGVLPGSEKQSPATAGGPVLVALVLPDAEGVLTIRALDRYDGTGTALRVSSVDPLASATVPGTSAASLAEAYSFGGGDGLAEAYAAAAGGVTPAWIIVSPSSWSTLMGATPVAITLPTDIDVFDGKELYSYAAGSASVPAGEIAQVMNGAALLSATDRKLIREAVGDALATAILQGAQRAPSAIQTNLTPEEITQRLQGINPSPIRADRTQ